MKLLDVYNELFGPMPKPISASEIPCYETSDAELLCKRPLVSVRMATYNHEKWIAQAIEGVVNQRTDFEYELVIGEDCSTDRTRDICFEYQRRYPDKIRVLWADVNVNNIGAGNAGRINAHCRGDFLATCEGDDYWTDPLRLQKQVDLIRTKDVDVCVAFHQVLYPDGRLEDVRYPVPQDGLIGYDDIERHYFHTTTYLVRRSLWESVVTSHPDVVRGWADTVLFPCFAVRGKFALLPEFVSVYRRTGQGVMTGLDSVSSALFGIKQGLLKLIWFPELPRREPSELVLSRIPYALQKSITDKCMVSEVGRGLLVKLFLRLQIQVFPNVEGAKAIVRMVQFSFCKSRGVK